MPRRASPNGSDPADAEATEAFGARAGGRAAAGRRRRACSARSAPARRRWRAGCCAGSAIAGDVASPTFPIVQAYAPPDTRIPLWHVDLYRIEHPAELDGDRRSTRRADEAALVIEWPERLPSLWPDALRLTLARRAGRRARLDSPGAARLGGAMAAPMIPPAHAPDFLAAHGWDGCEIRPLAGDASFRRYFRVHRGDGGARC